ncbi:MAG: hypothetical protein ABR975_06875 [Vulcanimicrobiaceae bacterium]|jgi:hypothetical protein
MTSEPEWEGLFDFSNPGIQEWEVENIREAARNGKLGVEEYAIRRAQGRGIRIKDVSATVRTGKAVEKDLPSHPSRAPGIAFERTISSTMRVKVKVGFRPGRYVVVTVHEV